MIRRTFPPNPRMRGKSQQPNTQCGLASAVLEIGVTITHIRHRPSTYTVRVFHKTRIPCSTRPVPFRQCLLRLFIGDCEVFHDDARTFYRIIRRLEKKRSHRRQKERGKKKRFVFSLV